MPSLNGLRVLVTRPLQPGQELAEMIDAAGGAAYLWPCIEIVPAPAEAIQQAVAELRQDAILIFVSPIAARTIWQALTPPLRERLQSLSLYAVGEGTAKVLQGFGCLSVHYPQGKADSEALLAMPQLQQVQGSAVMICRGQDGRELIAETLHKRGADVHYLSCYNRQPPQTDPQRLLEVWETQGFNLVILTSVDSLHNLEKMLGFQRCLLQQTPVTVMSERMEMAALACGIRHVHAVRSARNQELLAFISNFAEKTHFSAKK